LEALELVEEIQDLWPDLPKGSPVITTEQGKLNARLFIEVDGLYVVLRLMRGPRGGLYEEFVILDPTQRVVADRLLALQQQDGRQLGFQILDAGVIRHAIKNGATPTEALRSELLRFVQRATDRPEQTARMLRGIESTSMSVRQVSGGLPGLGRHDRGTGNTR